MAFFTHLLFDKRAYLDPGTGSYLIQILLAALLGGAFAVRMYWKKIVLLFKKPKKGESPDSEVTPIDDK